MNDNMLELNQRALQGDIRSQMILGYYYLCPENDVEPNYEEAIKYFKMAALMGVPEAEYQISECLQNIEPINLPEIFEWYLKAADHGFEIAYYNVALSYAYGYGTKQDFSKALFWAQKGCECEDARSTELMGEFYECGVGIDKDYNKAFECYLKADTLDSYNAPYQLYRCYANGIGVEKNISISIQYALKGAKNYHSSACMAVGYAYQTGEGIAKDTSKAIEYYRQAIENKIANIAEVYKNMALCYEELHDLENMSSCFQKAYELGDMRAGYSLAISYANGEGIDVDVEKAISILKICCGQEDDSNLKVVAEKALAQIMSNRGN